MSGQHDNNQWINQTPARHCHCKSKAGAKVKCYDRRCSCESDRNWAKREAVCLRDVLGRAIDDGQFIRCGNMRLPVDADSIKATLSRFGRSLKTAGMKWRYYIEWGKNIGLHIHFITIGREALTKAQIKTMWEDAIGQSADVYFAAVQGIVRIARYVTGDCEAKNNRPIFQRRIPITLCGGSDKFYPMPIAKLHQHLSHVAHAWALAENDPDLFEHLPQGFAYYLDKAEREHLLAKEAGRFSPTVDDVTGIQDIIGQHRTAGHQQDLCASGQSPLALLARVEGFKAMRVEGEGQNRVGEQYTGYTVGKS